MRHYTSTDSRGLRERQWRQRMAGLRTNALVAAGAAMFVMLTALTARTEQEAHKRALLLHSIGGQPLLLKSLKSGDVEHTDKVELQATLTSAGRQNALLEQIVSRLPCFWSVVASRGISLIDNNGGSKRPSGLGPRSHTRTFALPSLAGIRLRSVRSYLLGFPCNRIA